MGLIIVLYNDNEFTVSFKNIHVFFHLHITVFKKAILVKKNRVTFLTVKWHHFHSVIHLSLVINVVLS